MVRIPVEYQEVEYLESSGTQWIRTNISSRYSITVKSEIMFIIGQQDTYSVGFLDSNFRIGANGYYNGRSQIGYGATYRIGAIMQSDTIYKYKTICKPGEQNVYLNDSWVNTYNMTQPETELSGVKVGIFGRCKGETADLLSKARIYSLIISDNDESLGNFIPCYRKSDSEPGMYDTVTKQFFTNAGTGTFLVGNDVSWDTASLIERRRRILLNTPHLTTASANPLTFQTDISANLKDCKIYFEPVQEGEGDPSPENVRPISGWDGVTVARNWFANISSYENSVDGVTFTRNPESGIITIKGKATARVQRAFSGSFIANGDNYIFQNFPVLSGGLYWYVWDLTSSSVIRNGVLDLNDVKLKPTSGHNFSIAINIPKNATVDFTFKPVIYDETEAITLPFPQTIYGGYVDLARGEVVETDYLLTVDENTVPYNVRRNTGGRVVGYYNLPYAGIKDAFTYYSHGQCIKSTTATYNYQVAGCAANEPYNSNAIRAAISASSDITTVEQYPDWIASVEPLQIVYELATPITHQLTPQTIKTLKGINNIWSDSNGNIEVKFWKH